MVKQNLFDKRVGDVTSTFFIISFEAYQIFKKLLKKLLFTKKFSLDDNIILKIVGNN